MSTAGRAEGLALHLAAFGSSMDAAAYLGVVDLLTAAAARRAQRTVAEGEAARDVYVARDRASADEAATALSALAQGDLSAVDPALILLANAALLRLLAAHLQVVAAEDLARIGA